MKAPRSYSFQKFMCWLGIVPTVLAAAIFIPAAISDLVTGNYAVEITNTAADSLRAANTLTASGDKPTSLGILIGLGLCAGLVPAVFAVLMILRLVRINRMEREQAETFANDQILELAVTKNKRLTVIETSTALNMSLNEAQARLEKMVRVGAARLEVSESGVLVYYFDQIISDDEKKRSESV